MFKRFAALANVALAAFASAFARDNLYKPDVKPAAPRPSNKPKIRKHRTTWQPHQGKQECARRVRNSHRYSELSSLLCLLAIQKRTGRKLALLKRYNDGTVITG